MSELVPNPIRERARFNMTLGSFVKTLNRHPKYAVVVTQDGHPIGPVYSHSKHQGDIVFTITQRPINVYEFIGYCAEIMDRTIQGPDGSMTITHASPLWLRDLDTRTEKPLIDLIQDGELIRVISASKE